MIQSRRSGLTLVELLIVVVLGAIMMGAVFETLIVQEQTYKATGAMIQEQESLRTALGMLESELREVGSIGGGLIGQSDFAVASEDSVVFRAQRKLGVVCKLSRSEKWIVTWNAGDPFASGDSLLMFVDGDSTRYSDDRWDVATVGNAQASTDSECQSQWPDLPLQLLKIADHSMDGVMPGAPVRGYQWVTYSLYQFDRGWGLGRRIGDGAPRYLVSGLAPPREGLRFTYYTPTGATTNDPTAISRLTITARTDPRASNDVDPTTLSTNLYLRNN